MEGKKEKPTTKICKYCRSEIDIKAKICPNCRKKQGGKGKIVLLVILIIVILLIVLSLFGGSGSSSASSEPDEVVYVDEADIQKIYGDPDAYAGKYVKLTGKVFNIEKSDSQLFIQINQDIENYDNNTLVYYSGDDYPDVKDDDYVSIDGYITGSTSYENIVGGTISAPEVVAKSIEVISYVDAVVPTQKTIEPNQVVEKDGYTLTLTKVEFAEKETRCYFTFENAGNSEFDLWDYETIIVQGSSQYNRSYNYDGNYEELQSDIQPGVTTSGIVTFDGIDQNTDFSLIMTGYDNDSYEDYEFKFDVAVN
jgi:hypothetical protein